MKSHQYLMTKRFGLCLLFGVFSLFGVLLLSSGAKATNLTTETGDLWIDDVTYELGYYGTNAFQQNHAPVPSVANDLVWQFGYNNGWDLTRLLIKWKTNPPQDKAALVTFKVIYRYWGSQQALPPFYHGLTMKHPRVLLYDSCFNSTGQAAGNGTNWIQQYECTYLVYEPAGTNGVDTLGGTTILDPQYNGEVTIEIHPGNWVSLDNNGLSADDRTWLQQNLPDGANQADIENAIEDAREDEKEEYEEQQGDVESGADDAGAEAENATSSLISNAQNILETIRDTPATNCVIRIQRSGFDTGNIDLCAVPQTIRTMVATAITIPVTIAALHIIYSVVYTYLTAVRKEQE